eukprot:36366-Eustigmatos_ZCMA.PRE.1
MEAGIRCSALITPGLGKMPNRGLRAVEQKARRKEDTGQHILTFYHIAIPQPPLRKHSAGTTKAVLDLVKGWWFTH